MIRAQRFDIPGVTIHSLNFDIPDLRATTSARKKMTPKIPPSVDGLSSWFELEDSIDDWVNITVETGNANY